MGQLRDDKYVFIEVEGVGAAKYLGIIKNQIHSL
jgi:hypothetical protein